MLHLVGRSNFVHLKRAYLRGNDQYVRHALARGADKEDEEECIRYVNARISDWMVANGNRWARFCEYNGTAVSDLGALTDIQ